MTTNTGSLTPPSATLPSVTPYLATSCSYDVPLPSLEKTINLLSAKFEQTNLLIAASSATRLQPALFRYCMEPNIKRIRSVKQFAINNGFCFAFGAVATNFAIRFCALFIARQLVVLQTRSNYLPLGMNVSLFAFAVNLLLMAIILMRMF